MVCSVEFSSSSGPSLVQRGFKGAVEPSSDSTKCRGPKQKSYQGKFERAYRKIEYSGLLACCSRLNQVVSGYLPGEVRLRTLWRGTSDGKEGIYPAALKILKKKSNCFMCCPHGIRLDHDVAWMSGPASEWPWLRVVVNRIYGMVDKRRKRRSKRVYVQKTATKKAFGHVNGKWMQLVWIILNQIDSSCNESYWNWGVNPPSKSAAAIPAIWRSSTVPVIAVYGLWVQIWSSKSSQMCCHRKPKCPMLSLWSSIHRSRFLQLLRNGSMIPIGICSYRLNQGPSVRRGVVYIIWASKRAYCGTSGRVHESIAASSIICYAKLG